MPLGIVSNHEAEFKVLIEALKQAIANEDNQQTVLLHSDSKIVVQTIEKTMLKRKVPALFSRISTTRKRIFLCS